MQLEIFSGEKHTKLEIKVCVYFTEEVQEAERYSGFDSNKWKNKQGKGHIPQIHACFGRQATK